MVEFLQNHTNVIFQPAFDSPYYSGINPYTLGFAMMKDIQRICQNPTEEDKKWFPEIVGENWLKILHFGMSNFKDESFISQFLSPKVIRDLKLFSILDDDKKSKYLVENIHDERGYQGIRELLSCQYNLSNNEPNIQIVSVDVNGDRSLTLRHVQHQRQPLGETTDEVLKHVCRLWGFDVHLESMQDESVDTVFHCSASEREQ